MIGGGAKAAALAAKAACLREHGRADVHVRIFEPLAIGAHWSGAHGYTDGVQQLCTPADRDLGFPYDADVFGPAVASSMHSRFSWPAYLIRHGGDQAYARWVERGRPRPTHGDFADYLARTVAAASDTALPYSARVIGLERDAKRGAWTVEAQEAGGAFAYGPFDGVVVTSPGPPRDPFGVSDPRVLNGQSFWTSLSAVQAILADDDQPIVIIGAGGTAAAIIAWLIRNGHRERSIIVIADQAALYMRTSNYFEDRAFNDPDVWDALSDAERRTFSDRLTRGVVWEAVAETLAEAPYLSLRPGEAKRIKSQGRLSDGSWGELTVFGTPSRPGADPIEIPAALVVVAIGFDSWWFLDLLPPKVGQSFRSRTEELGARMRPDLSFASSSLKGLHAPGASQSVGPGFGSLMMLGTMSDRILNAYR